MSVLATPNAHDLSWLSDEELVERVKTSDCNMALNAILQRHYNRLKRLIASRGRRVHLRREDVEDAQHQAFFWLRIAVAYYNPMRVTKLNGSFRKFLDTVVMARLYNFARHLWRRRRHEDSSSELSDLLNRHAYELPCRIDEKDLLACAPSEPAIVAEIHELQARLDQALNELDEGDRSLWDELATREKLSAAARKRGVSETTVKRMRQALLTRIKARIGVDCD